MAKITETGHGYFENCMEMIMENGEHGGMMASTFASHLQVWGLISASTRVDLELISANALGVSSRFSSFLPQQESLLLYCHLLSKHTYSTSSISILSTNINI